MKITIDTSGINDERGLLGRAYVAAVVGPTRRPQGRPQSFTLTGQPTQLATNNIEGKVLFCTVALIVGAAPGAVVFSKDPGSAPGEAIPVAPGSRNFILYPGETLWGWTVGTNAAVQSTTTTEAF